MKPGAFDWENILKDSTWYHFSTIGQSLNGNITKVAAEALKKATELGLTVSADLNYRASLWKTRNPLKVIPRFVKNCDLIMGNLWSVEKLLGIKSPIESSAGKSVEALLQAAEETSDNIFSKYKKAKIVSLTFRLDDEYIGFLKERGKNSVYSHQKISLVRDRVGSGDCFMAGLIYSKIQNFENQKMIDFATSAAILKLSEIGDTTSKKSSDILNHAEKF